MTTELSKDAREALNELRTVWRSSGIGDLRLAQAIDRALAVLGPEMVPVDDKDAQFGAYVFSLAHTPCAPYMAIYISEQQAQDHAENAMRADPNTRAFVVRLLKKPRTSRRDRRTTRSRRSSRRSASPPSGGARRWRISRAGCSRRSRSPARS